MHFVGQQNGNGNNQVCYSGTTLVTDITMTKKLILESLANGIPAIHEDMVGYYKHSCMVCFHTQGYTSGVKFKVVREGMADTYYHLTKPRHDLKFLEYFPRLKIIL